MIFNPAGAVGPNKSDNLDTDSAAPSPWTFLFSMGLKILTAILGGATNNTGIDKVDNESSPMQVHHLSSSNIVHPTHVKFFKRKHSNILYKQLFGYNSY